MNIKWLLLMGCWLWFAQARSQSIDPQYNSKNTFTSEILTEMELEAFEKRASQKVEDFYNFLQVVSNADYDNKLRQDAKKQALELFSGKDCLVDGVKIEALLDSCLAIRQKAANAPFLDKVSVYKKFPLTPDVVGYSGMLEYRLHTGSSQAMVKRATMMLIKTEKLFGTEKKQVWTVYLCGINNRL